MEKEFVTYHQALALKELRFDGDYLKVYSTKWQKIMDEEYAVRYDVDYAPAPLKQQAFRFFRDKYNLDFHIKLNWMQIDFKLTYILSINYPTILDNDFDTYEEAEKFAIDVLIKIAKDQQLENNQ